MHECNEDQYLIFKYVAVNEMPKNKSHGYSKKSRVETLNLNYEIDTGLRKVNVLNKRAIGKTRYEKYLFDG